MDGQSAAPHAHVTAVLRQDSNEWPSVDQRYAKLPPGGVAAKACGRPESGKRRAATRACRGAPAADRDRRGAQGHLALAGRLAAGVPGTCCRTRRAFAERQIGITVPLRRAAPTVPSRRSELRRHMREYLSRGPIRPVQRPGWVASPARSRPSTSWIRRPSRPTPTANRFASRPPSLVGARTLLNVPMLKEGELIGAIGIYRQEVRPFTDKQIELVTELRRAGGDRDREHAAAQRAAAANRRLTESLEQQTATTEVLQGHQQLAWRARAGVQGHAGERRPASARPSSATCTSTTATAFRTVAMLQVTAE